MSAIELETRGCACGCGGTFRVMPGSRQRCMSQIHEQDGLEAGTLKPLPVVAQTKPIAFNVYRPSVSMETPAFTIPAAEEEKPMPTNHTGVTAAELAEALGVTVGGVYYWIKTGAIEPMATDGRTKYFDLERCRELLANRAPRKKAAPSEKKKRSAPNKPALQAAAQVTYLDQAVARAFRAYRRGLLEGVLEARTQGDESGELDLLRRHVGLTREAFQEALGAL